VFQNAQNFILQPLAAIEKRASYKLQNG